MEETLDDIGESTAESKTDQSEIVVKNEESGEKFGESDRTRELVVLKTVFLGEKTQYRENALALYFCHAHPPQLLERTFQ